MRFRPRRALRRRTTSSWRPPALLGVDGLVRWPAVLEVLCDECESALKFDEFEDTLRKEVLLTIGEPGGMPES